MTTYFAAPDGHGDDTLWVDGTLPGFPVPVLRRKDLARRQTHHWDELVARVIAGNPDTANGWTLQQLKQRQDIRGDHLERGHTAHCPCGATMNVPVEGWKA